MQRSAEKTVLQKTAHFFLTKMIAGVAVIVLLVAFIEWLRASMIDRTNLPEGTKALIVTVAEALIATSGYTLFFRIYDKRPVTELSAAKFIPGAATGFLTGTILQALFILIIFVTGTFEIVKVNPLSSLVGPFAFALTAGFVAEIIIIGIVFRLLEEQAGTAITLFLFSLVFTMLHLNMKGASFVSVGATAMQAGFLLPAAYIYSRNLWLPVFLHFGWDLAEPGIFGGINPSTSVTQGLLTSKIDGHILFTGGITGPQDSLSSLLLCLLTGIIFLLLAGKKNNFIQPRWGKPHIAA